ncbi:MAG: ribosome biogenesis GTP-binding protein YihA/YsxC [Pseudomonadota bacterium]|nr:ribosome biogenesis GTP-binding protein YihA/YsxC [Pseudomonadota bacterium]
MKINLAENGAAIDFSPAEYLVSAHLVRQWPEDSGAEVAFAGRSNVGKSSAINVIANRRGLARTSKTPGRTQQIVFFGVREGIRLVDLPGYGFAKAPERLRRHWEQLISDYLEQRRSLRGLVIPMDIRRPLTPLDARMVNWAYQLSLPVHILLTKADKLSRGKATGTLRAVLGELEELPLISVQLFSATRRQGVDEARERISELLLAEE